MQKNLIYTLITISSFIFSCDMEKEIDLDLPEYEGKMVIECYLEPGMPYKLSIFESVSYFETPQLPTVDNALVTITHNNIIDTLKYDPYLDPITGKFYNYRSINIVPADYNSEFFLFVKDTGGRIASSRTTILQPVPIDTVEFKFNSDSLAFPLTKFTDNTSTNNYYRYIVAKANVPLGESVVTNFFLDDVLFSSSESAIGSDYELEKNDSIIVSLFHISEDYFNFLESVSAAQDANGNPFGQPASIKSNIQGALGIFTGQSNDNKYLKVH